MEIKYIISIIVVLLVVIGLAVGLSLQQSNQPDFLDVKAEIESDPENIKGEF